MSFSPLCKNEVFVDLYKFKNDISRLKQLIPFIRTIQIMGGEPTLNPDLGEFIRETRKYYPYSTLRVVTNGTLLSRLDEKLWRDFAENDVIINISCYPAIYGKMEKIIETIKMHKDIREPMISQVSVFFANLSKFKKYPFNNTDFCRCYNLRDGKMSSCIITMYGHYYNNFFNKSLPFDTGIVDIYKDELTGDMLLKELNKPCQQCNYCQNYVWRLNSKFIEAKPWELYKKSEVPQESDWE